MVKRRKRDEYGNWVWEDKAFDEKSERSVSEQSQAINLDWRDYIALTIASLETFLLPFVIFILVMLGVVLALAFFR
ncbi:MAG: hypothetical protein OK439_07685 [Thaumarchaeota archaeon]|nr:hypothetical protein [Nitrososphaerota archaeon]